MRRQLAVFAAVVVLAGCSTVQTMWYRCDHSGFTGWDYERQCRILLGMKP